MNPFPIQFLPAVGKQFGRSILAGLALMAMFLAVSSAKAGCGDPRKNSAAPPALSWMNRAGQAEDHDGPRGFPTIVGLWHTKYTTDSGAPFVESFKTWHADGTEFEQAFLPPSGGDICFGVWKEVGLRTVRLHHVGLMFGADGSISGSFTDDETATVQTDNKTYKATFDFKSYDASGNLAVEVKGTVVATRITVS
jgi:hypothetical protein